MDEGTGAASTTSFGGSMASLGNPPEAVGVESGPAHSCPQPLQVYLLDDRLVFAPAEPHDSGALRYFPLDRIPVRGMPRGFQPRPGIALVENRQGHTCMAADMSRYKHVAA